MRLLSAVALLMMVIGCSDMSDNSAPQESKPINIETPDGNVVANKTTADPTPQAITIVTGDELAMLHSLGSDGPDFVNTYLPNTNDPDLNDYDNAFRAWQTSESKQHSNEEVIELLGSYLGNKCIADLDMQWVTVSDEYGTDYAVRGTKFEVMAFPFSTVMKRVEDDEYDFLYGVYHTIKQTLESGDYKERDDTSPNE